VLCEKGFGKKQLASAVSKRLCLGFGLCCGMTDGWMAVLQLTIIIDTSCDNCMSYLVPWGTALAASTQKTLTILFVEMLKLWGGKRK